MAQANVNVGDPKLTVMWNVSCSVTPGKKCVTLSYRLIQIPDPENRITWKWVPVEGNCHVAEMIALDSNRGHRSKPVPEDDYKKLSIKKPGRRVEDYYQVVLSVQDNVNVLDYFFN